MSKHTPGPWELFTHSPSGTHYIDAAAVQFSVKLTSDAGAGQMQANARLIAAAPELLEALVDVASQARHPDYDWPLCLSQQVDAAIKKARGEA